jgi:hypothetical protein
MRSSRVPGRPRPSSQIPAEGIGLDFALDFGYKITVDGTTITVSDGKATLTLPTKQSDREIMMAALETAARTAARNQRAIDRQGKEAT